MALRVLAPTLLTHVSDVVEVFQLGVEVELRCLHHDELGCPERIRCIGCFDSDPCIGVIRADLVAVGADGEEDLVGRAQHIAVKAVFHPHRDAQRVRLLDTEPLSARLVRPRHQFAASLSPRLVRFFRAARMWEAA